MMLSETNVQIIKSLPIFRDLEPEELLSKIILNIEEVDFGSNHNIFKQGTVGSNLYVITQGKVKVHIGELKLTELTIGSCFGEMSLFDGQPHSADITTIEPVKCIILTKEQIYQAIKEDPAIGINLIRVLGQRIRKLNTHISVWLRGLLTIIWSDGEYSDSEKKVVEGMIQEALGTKAILGDLPTITPSELGQELGSDPSLAENFLRTAVIVALANGTYSNEEHELLTQFCVALNQPIDLLELLSDLLKVESGSKSTFSQPSLPSKDLLQPIRNWLDELNVNTPYMAKFLCKMIPSQCPFERDIVLFGHKIVHIPPLCKINPLYEQLVGLRFRALCYLADECKEDVTPYI